MTTALGINNPNSRYNRFLRTSDLTLLLTWQAKIRVTQDTIRGVEMLRAFHYSTGNTHSARLAAVRLGCLRSALRLLQRGMA
jgi:hypothetical protein